MPAEVRILAPSAALPKAVHTTFER